MADEKVLLQKVASWAGFVASFLTLILGIIHPCYIGAKVMWPESTFTQNVNKTHWTIALFNFHPDSFADNWTPFVFGLLGTATHFPKWRFQPITKNYIVFLVFHLIAGLFATIGYRGGLGILFSIPHWLCCLLSLICIFAYPGEPYLGLHYQFRVWDKDNVGASIRV